MRKHQETECVSVLTERERRSPEEAEERERKGEGGGGNLMGESASNNGKEGIQWVLM